MKIIRLTLVRIRLPVQISTGFEIWLQLLVIVHAVASSTLTELMTMEQNRLACHSMTQSRDDASYAVLCASTPVVQIR